MDGIKHKFARFFSSERARSDVNLLPSAAGRQSNRLGRRLTADSGFTLIEMIVAVGLFAVVMLVCVGALLSLIHANRKAQALQSVMNNLNIALDGMVRSVRTGSDYQCDSGTDCPNGGTALSFKPNDPQEPRWFYRFNGTRLERSTSNPVAYDAITAPEVSIEEMRFFVVGTDSGDTTQPKVVIVIKGSAGAEGTTARTTFHIQATAVQRVLDL
ncbi:hypothetical protein A2704_05725 [Candidatus Kaiserbacteria bacterium RIFCSPHIGHO2_01_FULL_54_36b]|uniref:Type II secretion system protein n=1 Tax=Candidatus Kaiserbacteria bacterium RIFCSPHIGHO2_01_FULL_54_36b TaxID=1798483 RepID=A0A1F6CMW9_9BACT|nr:MAG: hypothetical protein A2704_05725 [Candidatus Kaiserbacteria bacterium RIFCSPHIGHO2_01_FULL_54_36b]